MSRFLISSSRQGMFEGQMKGLGINTQGTFICLNPLGPIKFAHLNYLRCSQRQRLAEYGSKEALHQNTSFCQFNMLSALMNVDFKL